jgi:site-specific DNA recombinase
VPPPSPLRVIAYLRVSTNDQATEGVSLPMQRDRLIAYAVAMDLSLVHIIEDAGVSAKTLDRPGLQQAFALLDQRAADGLLVLKLDRLTRSVRDLGELLERYFSKDFALLSVSDSIDTRSAAGRLILNVLTSVAQWEREVIGERTREALAHLKRQGKKLGAPVLERNDAGKLTQQRAVELRAEGWSLRRIAGQLREEGHATSQGGSWQAETVRLLLARSSQPGGAQAGEEEQLGTEMTLVVEV